MSFSQNLQYLRKIKGITQEELADMVGVSRQSVSKWETGDAFPETEKIIQLCDIFDVPMDVLMRGDAENYIESISAEKSGNETEAESDDPIRITSEEAERVKGFSTLPEKTQKYVITSAVSGVIFAIAAIAYICLGATLRLWHPAWIVFIFAIALSAFSEEFIRGKGGIALKLLRALRDSLIPLAAGIYLLLGFLLRLWHPGWVIFIVAAALTVICDIIKNAIKRKN